MSNQIDITGGARVRNLNGVITGSTGVLSSLPINGANGIPQLDSSGKILVSQLPNSVMEFLGTWNAATNTPTLVNGTGNAGDVYLCTVAGTVDFGAGPIYFASGDYVVYSGSTWERSSGAMGTVTSVGASITGNAIGLTGSPITTAGTLAFAFAGTAAQYVNGAGNLVTFPTTIAQAQRLITEVYNETGATLTKGTVVYINGGHGNLPTVTKAIATGDSTSAQTYGVVQNDITDNNNGYVVVIGSLGDLDTQAYAAGTQLYLSSTTAGAWTSTKQYAPAHLVYVGIVVRSHPTQGVVEVRIQNGFELDELHNVSAQTPSNNQGLFYNSSNQLWENKSIATALGYTPANQALVVPYTGATTDVDLGIYELQASLLKSTGILESDLGILTSYGITINKTGQSAGAAAGQMQIYAPSGTSSSISFQDGNTFFASRFNFDNTGNRTYTFPAASGTLALTSNLTNFITLASLSATSPLIYNNATGNFSIQAANVSQSGYLTATDWNRFDIAYTNRITSANSPLSITSNAISISQATTSTNGYLSSTDWNTFNGKQNALTLTTTGSSGASTLVGATLNIPTYTLSGLGGVPTSRTLTINGVSYDLSADRSWTVSSMVYPSAGIAVSTGTAWGTSIVDNSSNWNTAYSLRISSATAPLSISSNVISISQASSTTSGYLSSTDWNTFNNKQGQFSLTAGKVPFAVGSSSLGDTSLNYNGGNFGFGTAASTYRIDVSGSVNVTGNYYVNGVAVTTGGITGTGTTNYLPKFTGTSTIGNSIITDNGTNVGINTATPAAALDVASASAEIVRLSSTATNGSYIGFRNSGTLNGAIGTGANLIGSITNLDLGLWTTGSMVFQTNGAVRMRLDASGNLGLGVTPTGKLHIGLPTYTNEDTDSQQAIFGVASGYGVRIGYNETSNYGVINVLKPAVAWGYLVLQSAGGNVGIGTTTNAGYKLDVNGTGRFSNSIQEMLYVNSSSASGTVFRLGNTSTGGGDFRFYSSGSGNGEGAGRLLLTFNGASPILNIAGTGAATFSSSVKSAATSGAAGTANTFIATNSATGGYSGIDMYNDGNNEFFVGIGGSATGIWSNAGNIATYGTLPIQFITGATSAVRMTINSAGSVGIGTTSPDRALTVNGQIGLNNDFVSTKGGTTFRLGYEAYTSTGGVNMFTESAIPLVLGTSSTERMRITSGGVMQIANASGTLGTLVGSERLNVNGGIYAYGDITSGGTITFANNVINYGGNTNYKGATGSGDVTLSNNGSALLVTGPLQKNYGSSIKFVGNGSSSYDVDFLNAGFTTKTVKVLGSVHLETTDSSFVIPRMTTTQRDALNANNKIAGAMIYNTSVGHFQGYNGSGWTNFW